MALREVMQRLAAGDEVDPAEYYFRTVPHYPRQTANMTGMNTEHIICSGGAAYAPGIKLWLARLLELGSDVPFWRSVSHAQDSFSSRESSRNDRQQ